MSKTIYDKVLEKLKENKEVILYRFVFEKSGDLNFYTNKVYTAEDGDKIKKTVVLTSIYGHKYRLDKIKLVGTVLIRGETYIVREYLNEHNELIYDLYYGDIIQHSFSITEAMEKITNNKSYLYFLGKDGCLYAPIENYEKNKINKDSIELLLSKGLISKIEDFKEIEK